MLGRTHSLSGAAAWITLAATTYHASPPSAGLGALLCAGGALLPDLDQRGSTAARSLGALTGAAAWVIGRCSGGHRHGTHSIAGLAVLCALAAAVSTAVPPALAFAVPMGAAVHIAGDMLTWSGCPLLWLPGPLIRAVRRGRPGAGHRLAGLADRRFWLTPRWLRFTTGTPPELVVRVLIVAGTGCALWLHWRHGLHFRPPAAVRRR